MSLGGRTVTMSSAKKDAAHEELLSILRTAKNRLEYLTQNDWVLIVDRAQRTTFKKGDVLIHAGKQNKMVYWLVKGNARVEAASRAFIAQLEPGEVCGEMAFLENGVASASVVAPEALEVCAIEWPALTDLFELYPHMGSRFYRSLAVNLSRRMRDLLGARQGAKASN
jgi:extracellular factor (EF) 3-hydroxypalmitic acid methyl ester biosynthesis protein